jgi:hypothetical protein
VDPRRLTCGQPFSQSPFAQVSLKREDVTKFFQVRILKVPHIELWLIVTMA